MGMFDSVMVPCPNCSMPAEFQSKSGPCSLHTYQFDTAPDMVIRGIIGDEEKCVACGTVFTIRTDPPKRTLNVWTETI